MKNKITNSIVTFLWRNKYTLLIFFLIVFRPHIMKALRHAVMPVHKKSAVHKNFEKRNIKKNGRSFRIHKASFVILNADEDDGCGGDDFEYEDEYDTSDDGCSDDEGCESEEDSEYYSGDSSSDDGCSDDDGCETEDDGGYTDDDGSDDGCSDDDEGCESSSSYENDDYSDDSYDDGCYCGGEAVTGGTDGTGGYFNTDLRVQFTLSQASGVQVTVKDAYNYTFATIVNSSWLSANQHSYLWDGSYNGNQFIVPGNYTVALKQTLGSYVHNASAGFTYNNAHGFQVNGSSGYVIDFGTLN